jgi:hypothetical protein
MVSMGLGGEGQGFHQSPHFARHDATWRPGLSAAERKSRQEHAFKIVAPHLPVSVPPPLKIRSPQRIVSLQHLHHQIDDLNSLTLSTIRRDRFKHVEGHTVLRSLANSGVHRQILVSGKTPRVQCET